MAGLVYSAQPLNSMGTVGRRWRSIETTSESASNWRCWFVDAINEIFRVESAPYHLTPEVTREEPNSGPYGQGTTIHTVAWPRVVRAEDEVTFSEAIVPALSVLSAPPFGAANLEFREALDEYRKRPVRRLRHEVRQHV